MEWGGAFLNSIKHVYRSPKSSSEADTNRFLEDLKTFWIIQIKIRLAH